MSTGGLVDALPDPSNLDTLGAAAIYAVVFGFLFAECGLLIGFLLPGDTLLVAAGAVAATQPERVSLAAMVAGAFVAAVTGEVVGYLIGARAGPTLLRRQTRLVSPTNLARARRLTDRYGSLAVLAARWIPWARTFVPTLAGAIGMPWPRFLLANVAGALCWVPTLVVVGYFAASIPALRPVALIAAALAVGLALVAGLVRWRLAVTRRDRTFGPDSAAGSSTSTDPRTDSSADSGRDPDADSGTGSEPRQPPGDR